MANYDASYLWPVQQEEGAVFEIYASVCMTHRRERGGGRGGDTELHKSTIFQGVWDQI